MNNTQKFGIVALLPFTFYLLLLISRYWYSDILYAKAKAYNSVPRPDLAVPLLSRAISYTPAQAIYYGELANSYTTVAMAYDQAKNASAASEFVSLADTNIKKSVELAPANINLRRSMFSIYVKLSTIDEKYLQTARNSLSDTIKMTPTDAKLYYYLGIADTNLDKNGQALIDFKTAIDLKSNYTEARINYAALLSHLNRNSEAKDQLNYILTKIDPGNSTAKQALENIK